MHSDHMERRFPDPAEFAKRFDDPSRDEWQKPGRVIAALQLKPGQRVADIGAGTGYFSVRLARCGLRVYAVDTEKAMADYLRARASKEGLKDIRVVYRPGADNISLPAAVDVALLVNVWHHIPDRAAYARKLSASLKPGGRVAIIDFKRSSPMGPPRRYRMAAAKIRAELSEAGYTQTGRYTFLPFQHFLVFAKAEAGAAAKGAPPRRG